MLDGRPRARGGGPHASPRRRVVDQLRLDRRARERALPLTRLSAPYDKRHPLAFGETVPLADQIPWLRRTFARGTGLVPGDHSAPLEAGPVRDPFRYEDNLPEAGREAMTSGGTRPNPLVNLTNDAWFAGSARASCTSGSQSCAPSRDAPRSRAGGEPRPHVDGRRRRPRARPLRRAVPEGARRGGRAPRAGGARPTRASGTRRSRSSPWRWRSSRTAGSRSAAGPTRPTEAQRPGTSAPSHAARRRPRAVPSEHVLDGRAAPHASEAEYLASTRLP